MKRPKRLTTETLPEVGQVEGTSAGFDNSNLGGSYIGLSINGGASAAWTVTQVIAEAKW